MTTSVNMSGAIPSLGSSAEVDTSAATTYTDINGLSTLKQNPTSPQAIDAVAQQVEALFLQMMLKSMREATAADDPDSNEMGMYQDMFDKQVALSISQHADLGIGKLLKRQLTQRAAGAGLPAPGAAAGATAPAATAPGAGSAPTTAHAKGTAQNSAAGPTPEEFVERMLPPIRRVASELNLNPQALLAQAALETAWGQRLPRSADGSSSNNMFGIKAGEEWNGARVTADTVEVSHGVASTRRTAFRAYASIEASVNDFAKLLASSPRYKDALSAGGDAQTYVASIGKSGYASDPDYANKLNKILNSEPIQALRANRIAKL
jgi:flagellar protein FlgJ